MQRQTSVEEMAYQLTNETERAPVTPMPPFPGARLTRGAPPIRKAA